MKAVRDILSSSRLVCPAIAFVSLFSLAAALTAEHVFGLKPCDLCLLQRIPFAATFFLGAAGFFFAGKKERLSAFLVFVSALAFLAGGGLAFYHNGVEQHWWTSFLEGCRVTFETDDVQALLQNIQSAGSVPCDQIPWKDPFLGLSMAAWNAIISPILGATALYSSILIARRFNGAL